MRESKQDQFRIGGVYRTEYGLIAHISDCSDSWTRDALVLKGETELGPAEWRIDGGYFNGLGGTEMRLVPGELAQNSSGEWVALGVEKQEPLCNRDVPEGFWTFTQPGVHVADVPAGLCVTPADLAMIARDGAKPKTIRIRKPPQLTLRTPAEPTAKPAISGLQREYSSTHLLGSYR